jgi:hypothetical protein
MGREETVLDASDSIQAGEADVAVRATAFLIQKISCKSYTKRSHV